MTTFDPTTPFTGIEVCVVHGGGHMDPECPICTEEYVKRDQALQAQGNQARLLSELLGKSQMSMPTEAILQIRLETLVDCLLGKRDRMIFEGECGSRIVKEMQSASKRVAAETGLLIPSENGSKVQRPKGGNVRNLRG